MDKGISVYSEIGHLRSVLLHRPGRELENLTRVNMESLLFDDIPDVPLAQAEHDCFAKTLQDNGAEVLYIERLLEEVLCKAELVPQFLTDFLADATLPEVYTKVLYDYLCQKKTPDLVESLIAGVRREELTLPLDSLEAKVNEHMMVLDPLPNLYFMRDPFSSIGEGISLNCMSTKTRQRETRLLELIFDKHERFANVPRYFDRGERMRIEGGDILVLSQDVLALGISERTEAMAVETLAERLLHKSSFSTVLAFCIPAKRAFMHLDTVFTMIDRDAFTVHSEMVSPLVVYALSLDADGAIQSKRMTGTLSQILGEYLGISDIRLIRCGGDSLIDAQREQWSDGSNTLAIKPGEVVVYQRNRITNRLLEEAGIKLHIIPSSELSRGRGGPRCMSMPLWRSPLA